MGLLTWIKGLTRTEPEAEKPGTAEAGHAFDLLFAPPSSEPISRPQPELPEGGGPCAVTLLDIRNRFSSTEHYYHFILGFLAPLSLDLGQLRSDRTYLVRSCGPMDVHLRALGLSNVEITPKQLFAAKLKQDPGTARVLRGYDAQSVYDGEAFGRVRRIVATRLGVESRDTADILLINRGKSPDYYQSDASEVKTSANLRRSIPNMPELSAALAAANLSPRLIELENASLAQQVELFANARAVVAQHGAALVNMIWMPPGSVIVEINPKAQEDPFVDCFRELARVCGHHYIHVAQTAMHAAIRPHDLLASMRHAFPDMAQSNERSPGRVSEDEAQAPSGGWPEAALPVSRMHLPAWRGRFEKTCALLAARTFDVVWIGDSIVQQFEWGGPEPWQDYVPIWDEFYRPRNAINLGFGGDDTTHLIWRLLNGHLNLGSAKLVILLIGTNNFGDAAFGADETVTAIARIAGLITDRFPSTHVAVLSLIPNGRGSAANLVVHEVNTKLSQHLHDSDRTTFVDVSDIFLHAGELDQTKFRDPLQSPDRQAIHPNASAQAAIAVRLEPILRVHLTCR